MDGTLTRPIIDFDAIRRELGFTRGDVADWIRSLPPDEQPRAWAVVEAHEERAMREQEIQEGAADFLREARRRGLRLGIVTRNAQRSVDHFCSSIGIAFDAVVTREFPHMKPHPEPVRHILAAWDLAPERALMIGDYVHDMACGRAAGTATCFFQNPNRPDYSASADFTVASMAELAALVFADAPSAKPVWPNETVPCRDPGT